MGTHTMQEGFKAVPPLFLGGKMGSALQGAPELQQGMGPVCICQGADKGGSDNSVFITEEFFSWQGEDRAPEHPAHFFLS